MGRARGVRFRSAYTMRQRIPYRSKSTERVTESGRTFSVLGEAFQGLMGISENIGFKLCKSKVLEFTELAPELLLLTVGQQVCRQVFECILQPLQLFVGLSLAFADCRRALRSLPYNRSHGRYRLTGHEHYFEFEDSSQLDQTGEPEVHGAILNFRDVALRHASFLAQLTLAEPLGFTGSL